MKHLSIFAVCLSAVFALALAASAFAQNPPDQQGKRAGHHRFKKLKRMDANHDGQISRDEWKGRPKAFDRLDTNHDGQISRNEAAAARDQGTRHLKRMDANNDGQISRSEWTGNPDAFSKLDVNNDGSITRDELKAARRRKDQRPPQ